MSIAHFQRDYDALSRSLAEAHPDDVELAMAKLIGSPTVAEFRRQGDQQVEILRRVGLANGHSIYDLGCGSGRTAHALRRLGWTGTFKGADIQKEAVAFLNAHCEGFPAVVWMDLSIDAGDDVLDLVYAWSVFTHLMHEETFIYIDDIFRALKPGGQLVFSFLEFAMPTHWTVFEHAVATRRAKAQKPADMFLHRDQIADWGARLGYGAPEFINGTDATATSTGLFGQSVVVMRKPG